MSDGIVRQPLTANRASWLKGFYSLLLKNGRDSVIPEVLKGRVVEGDEVSAHQASESVADEPAGEWLRGP